MKPGYLLAFALSAVLAAPQVAAAQGEPSSWLLKYISFYGNVGSNPPNTQEKTIIRLYGWYPYDCGGVRSVRVIDPGHVSFTLRQASTICGDTLRQWSADFDLGYLPLGDHELSVTRTFVAESGIDSVTETASFSFPVVDLGQPPPPPPPTPTPVYWVIPYLSGWSAIPPQPNAQQTTTVVLLGVFPYDCGVISHAAVVDSGHIEFTMEPGPACADTTRQFAQPFDLGMLTEGYHVIHIKRTLVWPDSTSIAEGDFGFPVWANPSTPPPPPPPGPPEHPSLEIRCLSGWYTTGPPTTTAPTTLMLWGWFPYLCGQTTNAAVVAPNHVQLTLRPGPACSETTSVWYQTFDLGVLPAGPNTITITLDVENDPVMAMVRREATITLQVDDVPVTNGIPNPFVTDTRFTVSASQTGPVDVAIFDLNGRRVATLFQGVLPAGNREFRWDGRRSNGSRAAIGVYFSRVAFSHRVVTRRLVMLPRR